MKFLVKAPATTANLGPGFDCLGLALDLWNEVLVDTEADNLQITIKGEGASTLPQDQTNAIYEAMTTYARSHGKTLPSFLKIECKNKIPLGSGLGSSAAAAVSGILAASALLDLSDDEDERLIAATKMEGHPDNVAPCLRGGLVASLFDQGKVVSSSIPVLPFALVVVTPDFSMPTKEARAVLPASIEYTKAVSNLSRSVLLVVALHNSDFSSLDTLMQDNLHQPYRLPLIPGANEAISAGKLAGAASVVLSGAGPSLLAVLKDPVDAKQVGDAMSTAFTQAGVRSRIFTPFISQHGASIVYL